MSSSNNPNPGKWTTLKALKDLPMHLQPLVKDGIADLSPSSFRIYFRPFLLKVFDARKLTFVTDVGPIMELVMYLLKVESGMTPEPGRILYKPSEYDFTHEAGLANLTPLTADSANYMPRTMGLKLMELLKQKKLRELTPGQAVKEWISLFVQVNQKTGCVDFNVIINVMYTLSTVAKCQATRLTDTPCTDPPVVLAPTAKGKLLEILKRVIELLKKLNLDGKYTELVEMLIQIIEKYDELSWDNLKAILHDIRGILLDFTDLLWMLWSYCKGLFYDVYEGIKEWFGIWTETAISEAEEKEVQNVAKSINDELTIYVNVRREERMSSNEEKFGGAHQEFSKMIRNMFAYKANHVATESDIGDGGEKRPSTECDPMSKRKPPN